MKTILTLLFISFQLINLVAQVSQERIVKGEFVIPEKVAELSVENHHGKVVITGEDRETIGYDLRLTITANSTADAKKGIAEMDKVWRLRDSVMTLTLNAPWMIHRDCNDYFGWFDIKRRPSYKYKMDIVLHVPNELIISAFTVDKGGLIIKDILQVNRVRHVNGDISLANVQKITSVSGVNGSIELDGNAIQNTAEELTIETVNGSVNFLLNDQTDLSFHFKSMNGYCYADIPIKEMPGKIVKSIKTDEQKTMYRYSQYTSVNVGRGGKEIYIETLNGNVYLKKQSK